MYKNAKIQYDFVSHPPAWSAGAEEERKNGSIQTEEKAACNRGQ